MFKRLLDEWSIERANRMMLLPSDNTREWLEDFATWLDYQSAQHSVQTELGWTCLHCGRENIGNVCTGCGYGATYRPSG